MQEFFKAIRTVRLKQTNLWALCVPNYDLLYETIPHLYMSANWSSLLGVLNLSAMGQNSLNSQN